MVYQEIGKIIDSQGINGDLIVKLKVEIDNNIKELYIKLNFEQDTKLKNNTILIYKIEKFLKIDKERAIIKFREISERSQAIYLKGKSIFIKSKEIEKNLLDIEKSKFSDYKIISNKNKRQIGKIVRVKILEEKTRKIIMLVKSNDQLISIPYEENIIERIDHKKKVIYVKLPEELLEAFISSK